MSRIRELVACVRARLDGPAGSTSIKPAAVAAELADLQLIDVREPGEWRSGHVAGAVHIPLRRLEQSLGSIDANRRIAVICQSGMRSRQGVRLLRKHSLDAVNVSGGMSAWSRAGLPVVSGTR